MAVKNFIAKILVFSLVLAAPGQPCYAAIGRVAGGTAGSSAVPGAAGAARVGAANLGIGSWASPIAGMSPFAVPLPAVGNVSVRMGKSGEAAPFKTIAPMSIPLPQVLPAPQERLAQGLHQVTVDASAHIRTTEKDASSPGSLHSAGSSLQSLLSGLHLRRESGNNLTPQETSPLGTLRYRNTGLSRQTDSRTPTITPAAAKDLDVRAPPVISTPRLLSRKTWTAFNRARAGLKSAVRKTGVALVLLTALAVAAPTQAQDFHALAAAQAQQGQPAPATKDTLIAAQEKFIRAQVEASASVSTLDATVGEAMELTITLKNTGPVPITVPSVRTAIEESLPFTLELRGNTGTAPFELAPGETKTLVFSVVPFDSGEIRIEGAMIRMPDAPPPQGSTAAPAVDPLPTVIVIPDTVFSVKSVLTPDWKKTGFKDISDILQGKSPSLAWLLTLPLGLLLLIGVERILAARREGRRPAVFSKPLMETTMQRIAALEEGGWALAGAVFHAEVFSILDTMLIDLHGLEKRERGARILLEDAAASKKYTPEQISLARKLANTSETIRFGGPSDDSEVRRKSLIGLKALAEDLFGTDERRQDPPSLMGLTALFASGSAALSFGQPWVLLLVIPLGAYLLWRMSKKKAAPFAVSSTETMPGKKTWRQRFRFLPSSLRVVAATLLLLALSQPRVGIERQETYVPSTDTVMSIDLSGSMDTKFGTGRQVTQLEAAREAVKAYVIEQRRGTTNRVGMVTFTEDSYLDVRLTTDYDALIAHLKELDTSGSTAVGKSILAGITHFLEVNAYELNDPNDARIQAVQKLLDTQGLAEALEYAKQHTDLLANILQPDRAKILVLFSDGGSNAGISMADAAGIAKKLGIRIYTVGINTTGADETNLKSMSETTGGIYFQVGDADGMRTALLDISRLEKSPSLIRSKITTKDFGDYLLMLALLMLGLEATLSSTRLRSLSGIAMLAGLGLMLPNPQQMMPSGAHPQVQLVMAQAAETRSPQGIFDKLPLTKMPQELAEANTLYFQGRYDQAVKKYAETLQRYPDIPEIYFNTGNALMRMGDAQRAAKYYQEYLKQIAGDKASESKTFFNLGNAAILQRDLGRAIELYRESLRRDAANLEAKWNLEVAMEMLKQQKENEKDGKGKGKKGKGKPGNGKPGDGKPGDGKPGDGKPGDGKPAGKGNPEAGKPKPGEQAEGIDELKEEQGKVESDDDAKQRNAVPKTGEGVWGLTFLPLAAAGQAALSFTNPVLMWSVFVLVPIIAGLLIYSLRKKLQAARALSPLDAPKSFKQWDGRTRWLTKFSMLMGSLVLGALAAGSPIFGEHDTTLNFGGKDILVTTDVSQSMIGAEDGRLEQTKKELMEFIRRMEGTDRVGLVVFAGKARTASPLSIDYANFEFKMRRLEREARNLSGGSDLAAAIDHTIKSFETTKKIGDRDRILIVISDGDIFQQELEDAIRLAKSKGITIYTIGVGSTEGVKIALPAEPAEGNAPAAAPEYLIDAKTGKPALSRLDEDALRRLAQSTGGAYFRAEKDSGINKLLSQVAAMQKGQKNDSIQSPRQVAPLFLWPGLVLLLLEFLLPGVPLLRTRGRAQAPQRKSSPGTSLHGAALLGLAVPLSLWPQLLPFAALITGLAGLLLYDMLNRGAVSRRLLAWAQRREPVKGLERDLGVLFDTPETGRERFRDADLVEVRGFIAAYRDASGAMKTQAINAALADKGLWRQKLLAAYLSEALHPSKETPENLDALLGALSAGSRTHLTQLDPVLNRLIERRAELSWLNHPTTLRALARLSHTLHPDLPASKAVLKGLADEPDAVVRQTALDALEGERAPPVRRTWTQRIGFSLTALFLAGMFALTAVSGIKTLEFHDLQTKAAQTQLSIFFAEDMYILNDQYTDTRIRDKVVPALKRWNKTDASAREDLQQAIGILRSSPDPKADNVLESMFKRADMLPMTVESETLLLKTLLERDNDQVWKFLKRYMAENAKNPLATERLQRMIQVGAEVGSDRVFNNLFYFLTSPNPQVRDLARGEISKSLLSPSRSTEFLTRLQGVSAHHADDSMLQLWVEFFTLDRLARAGAEGMSLSEVDTLIGHVMKSASKSDKDRLAAIQQIKPGEEDKLPPALQDQAIAVMLSVMQEALGAGGAVPDPLAQTVQKSVQTQTTALIKEALDQFPGLKEKLQARGVLLPDPPPTVMQDYEDDEGFGHPGDHYMGRGGGNGTYTYVDPEKKFREHYTLSHLRELQEALRESAAGVKDLKPEQREFLDRATRVLTRLTPAAEMAGVLEGGSVGEAAAMDLNKVLVAGNAQFAGDHFAKKLRAEGLAPNANMPVNAKEGLRRSYSAEDIDKIAALLDGLITRNEAWETNGAKRGLKWNEKKYIAGALEEVDTIRGKHYAGAKTQQVRSAATVIAQITDLQNALNAGNAAAIARAEKVLRASYGSAVNKDMFLAQLVAAQEKFRSAKSPDGRLGLWTMGFIAGQYAAGADFDADGMQEAFGNAFKAAREADKQKPLETQTWSTLTTTLDTMKNSGRGVPAGVRNSVKEVLDDRAEHLAAEIVKTFGDTGPAASQLDEKLRESYIIKTDGKVRDDFKVFHLRELAKAVTSAAKLKPDQAAFAKESGSLLTSLTAAAQTAGIADGGSVAERLAEELNDVLHEGYMKFPGSHFNEMLRAAKLAPPGTSNALNDAYAPSYSAGDILKIYKFYDDMLRSGKYAEDAGVKKDLLEEHKLHLVSGLEKIARMIEKFYPEAMGSISSQPLGTLMAALADTDAKLRAAYDAAAADGSLWARLSTVAEASSQDAVMQRRILTLVLEHLGGPQGAALSQGDMAVTLIDKALANLQKEGKSTDLWSSLRQALDHAEYPEGLSAIINTKIHTYVSDLIDASEKADFEDIRDIFEKEKVRKNATTHWKTFKQSQLKDLRAIILDVSAKTAKVQKLTDEQKSVRAQASQTLPRVLELGVKAGMLPGDTPGEKAAETVNSVLHDGHMKFTGQNFIKHMRAKKFALEDTGYDQESSWRQSYTPDEARAILQELQTLLDSGQSWDYQGAPQTMTPDEKEVLKHSIKTLEGLLKHYPNAGPEDPKKIEKAMGFAPLGLAPLDLLMGGWPIISVAAFLLVGTYLLVKHLRGTSSTLPSEDPREISPEVFARYKLLEVNAKRMASAMTAGQFRSRFVGASGTEIVELADYVNEDRKAINWKASAKRDEPQVNRFEQEKEMPLILLIDVSDSSVFGTSRTDKKTVIQDAAATLALAAAHNNVRVGAVFFSDRIEEYMPPQGGKRHAWDVIRRLMDFQPTGRGTDLNVPLDFALKNLRARSMVSLISDFISPEFSRTLGALAQRHDLRPIRVVDPSEQKPLPDVGLLQVADAESGEETWVDTSSQAGRSEQLSKIRRREQRLEDALHAARTRPITLSTDGEYIEDLANGFTGKTH